MKHFAIWHRIRGHQVNSAAISGKTLYNCIDCDFMWKVEPRS